MYHVDPSTRRAELADAVSRDRDWPTSRWTTFQSGVAAIAAVVVTPAATLVWYVAFALASCNWNNGASELGRTLDSGDWWMLGTVTGVVSAMPVVLAIFGANQGFRRLGVLLGIASLVVVGAIAWGPMTDPASYWTAHC
jgi:hypothetical protein